MRGWSGGRRRRKRGCEEVQRIYNSYSRALNSYGSEVTSYNMVVKGYILACTEVNTD